MADLASVRVVVYGRVQGVFFRAFAAKQAKKLSVTGYVRNLPGGDAVEVWAEGERRHLEDLIDYLRVGSPASSVEKIETRWSAHTGRYPSFSVRY